MAVSEQISRLAPYVGLLDDDLQDEVSRLVTNLRDGSRRARREGPAKATSDRKLQSQLSAALAAATHIGRTLKQPEPPPKRHLVRRIVIVAAVAGAAAIGYRQLAADGPVQSDGATSDAPTPGAREAPRPTGS
jgi:hypothetical protein